MNSDLVEQFVTLWVVIDPIGTMPIFLGVTAGRNAAARRLVAIQAVAAAFAILTFFLVFGQFLIDALGISLPAFQIAGGLVLFLFALTMIFGMHDSSSGMREGDNPAIFPLAIPSLASPGAMLAVVLLTDNNRFSVPEQVETFVIMVIVLGLALVAMLASGPIMRVIRRSGAVIVGRVMGMILAAVATENVIEATFEIIQLYKGT